LGLKAAGSGGSLNAEDTAEKIRILKEAKAETYGQQLASLEEEKKELKND